MIGLKLLGTDPAYNLALEEYLFLNLEQDHPGWFLLWQNAPSIIVGRHQNTLEEVNSDLVHKQNLKVVRRLSGGGAVYHDLGNLNYSFLVPKNHNYNKFFNGFKVDDMALNSEKRTNFFQKCLNPIIYTLKSLGFSVKLSGRNDIILNGKKISGCAQLRKQHKILHHGTLLVSLDMDMLGLVLMGAKDKFTSKGIDSIRSRVANLSEYATKDFSLNILQEALFHNCANEIGSLTEKDNAGAKLLAEEKYNSWAWNYGASPAFTHKKRHRFSWGAVEVCFVVERGHIAKCQFYGDFFSNNDISGLESILLGKIYEAESLLAVLETVDLQQYFLFSEQKELIAFICDGV